MNLIISLTVFTLCVVSFFKCKKYFLSMIICMLLWYFVRYISISPLDPKYILVLYFVCIIPAFISSMNMQNKFVIVLSKFAKFFMHLISFVIVIISSLILSYYHVYGSFGETQLLGVLQTNINESLEGMKLFVGLRFFIYFPLFIFLVNAPYMLKSKFKNHYNLNLNIKHLITYKLSLCFISFIYVIYVCSFQNFDQKNMMIRLVKSYFKTYKKSFEIAEQRKNIVVPDYKVRFKEDEKTIILVVGESATKNHMGAYGYFRDTTPWLSRQVKEGAAILFENAFSSHALTALTVPLMISESKQSSFDDIPKNLSVINIFNKLGFNTYWFSSQGQLQGALYLFPLLNEAGFKYFSSVQYLNRSENYDSELIDNIKKIVDFSRSNFIVIHLMGSHFYYKYRYPRDFSPNLQPIELGFYGINNEDKIDKIDSYDKSIAYTDSFFQLLSSVFDSNENVAIVYLSDHGESVVGNYQHDYSKELNVDMFSIPFFIWMSDNFKKVYNQDYEILSQLSSKYFTNDRANDVIKYLAGIDIDIKDAFIGKYEDVTILHGKKKLKDLSTGVIKSDIVNIKSKFGGLCVSGKTNTLKKIMIAEESGFDGVEMELFFDENSNALLVANQQKNSGLTLDVYLAQMKKWSYKRLIFSINNISDDNKVYILGALNSLNKKYDIINKTFLTFPDSQNEINIKNWKILRNFYNSQKSKNESLYFLVNYNKLRSLKNYILNSDDKFVLSVDNISKNNSFEEIKEKYFFDTIIYDVVTDGEL